MPNPNQQVQVWNQSNSFAVIGDPVIVCTRLVINGRVFPERRALIDVNFEATDATDIADDESTLTNSSGVATYTFDVPDSEVSGGEIIVDAVFISGTQSYTGTTTIDVE